MNLRYLDSSGMLDCLVARDSEFSVDDNFHKHLEHGGTAVTS